MDRKSNDVPHDIVESILSRLPVKSLNRFKGVCKQWLATISNSKFAETHLQLSNTSPCSFLKLHDRLGAFRRVVFENEQKQLQELSFMEYHPVRRRTHLAQLKLMCHCDGLFLHWRSGDVLVWNPSNRTFKEVFCPYSIDVSHGGVFYDPLLKDYKVVIGDVKHYAVYNCKSNSWSELKEKTMTTNINVEIRRNYPVEGVCYKGSMYWISSSRLEDGPSLLRRFQIVCFDGRDEAFKNFTTPDCIATHAQLISSRDCLYFIPVHSFDDPSNEMAIMKKVGDEDDPWMELKLELPWACKCIQPICSMKQGNKIMLMALFKGAHEKYLLYDDTERSVVEIQTTGRSSKFVRIFPVLENFLLL